MTYDFHPDAQSEFHDCAHWYEDQSAGLGDRFIASVRAAINIITNDPGRFQRIDERLQVFRLKRFPHRIYYVHEPLIQHVRVYAVMHEKRLPYYWRVRLPES